MADLGHLSAASRPHLVEVGERVRVLGERVVKDAVLVAVRAPPELVQIDDKERLSTGARRCVRPRPAAAAASRQLAARRDVVRPPLQVVPPVACGMPNLRSRIHVA